ncbi:MAG TPA: hypothetical protein VHE53_02580 [Patescibacteria group bacterium]|nr:hypothetical protein [Patescibacteria group bacterium]
MLLNTNDIQSFIIVKPFHRELHESLAQRLSGIAGVMTVYVLAHTQHRLMIIASTDSNELVQRINADPEVENATPLPVHDFHLSSTPSGKGSLLGMSGDSWES